MTQPSSLQALFAELKRRRVFRVMAVYGAVSFVLLQAADLVFPILELPSWTLQFVLMITILGFPLAIVIAWAFEATDEGIRRAVPANEEEIRAIVALPASRRWPAGLMALAGMGLLFWSGWWLGNRGGLDDGGANLLVGEARAADFRTLAALPFRNVNGDEDNGIIAIGIHEDLLAQLSRIAALRVTSRTSVSEYQETEKSLKDIAGELGVEYLLEGSVQSSGPRVRVHVRLVDAATDQALWTHQFDQEVTPENLFDIQSQISRTVVEELEAHLTPQESATLAAMGPSGSSAAQQWYYRGLAKGAGSLTDLPDARDAFAQAVAIDSTYAAAWSQLARVASRLAFVGAAEDSSTARTAAERAAALRPNSVEAHLARGYNEYYVRRNFDAALSAFRAAERLAPSDADAVWAVGLILRRQGEWDESTTMFKRAVQLDPRNLSRLETLAENLQYHGAYADVDAVVERALSVDPTSSRARSDKVLNLFLRDGDTKRARGLAAELRLDPRRFDEGETLTRLAYADRDYPRMLELSGELEARGVAYVELAAAWWALLAARQLDQPGVEALADSVHALAPAGATEEIVPALQGLADALGGRRARGLEELRVAAGQLREWSDHVLNTPLANAVVVAYGALGELDAGFEVLDDHVVRPGSVFAVTELRTSPGFDPYRDDPRFAALVERRERFEAEGAQMGEAGRPWLP